MINQTIYVCSSQAPEMLKLKISKKSVLFVGWILLRNIHKLYSSEKQQYGNCLLLTAHPDDESMFFTPFVFKARPFILCLSDGGADGLGQQRRQEMKKLCSDMGIQYAILNYRDNTAWSHSDIARDVLEHISREQIECLVTFGNRGVSGHHNHISCHRAAKLLQEAVDKTGSKGFVRFKYLRDWPIFQKYFFSFTRCHFILPFYSLSGFRQMCTFKTQMVWFRYLYCVFSNYMHSNAFYE